MLPAPQGRLVSDRGSRPDGMPQRASALSNGNTCFATHIADVDSLESNTFLGVDKPAAVKCSCFSQWPPFCFKTLGLPKSGFHHLVGEQGQSGLGY